MPLTPLGRRLKGVFVEEYGKHRGLSIFYKYSNKNPKLQIIRKGGKTKWE